MGLCVVEAALTVDAWLISHVSGHTPVFMKCPACCHPHVDMGELAAKAHRHHVCQRCGEKFKGNCAAVGTPLPPTPLLTTALLE